MRNSVAGKILITAFMVLVVGCGRGDRAADESLAPAGAQNSSHASQSIFDGENSREADQIKPEENDCESSPAAYQTCIAQMRDDTVNSGLPKEYYGNWKTKKDFCNLDGDDGVYIDAQYFSGFEDPCEIEKVDRVSSAGHIQLSLKCPDDYTDENSGFYKRTVKIILVDKKLEISEDSRDTTAGIIRMVRCP